MGQEGKSSIQGSGRRHMTSPRPRPDPLLDCSAWTDTCMDGQSVCEMVAACLTNWLSRQRRGG